MRPDKRQRFAALPLRALRDQRLGARHIRVLGIIAAHDQLNRNGSGCWASQRRLANLAGCGETRLSHTLSELRDFGYITSAIHATKRRLRIHRVVHDDERDKNWDHDTCPTGQASKPADTCPTRQWLPKSSAILAQNEEKIGASESNSSDLGSRTYVLEHIKIDTGATDGTDCAEARIRSVPVPEAERYLTECEALAASSDRDNLKFERSRIAQLADDACLPEQVTERAGKLLSQIPSG